MPMKTARKSRKTARKSRKTANEYGSLSWVETDKGLRAKGNGGNFSLIEGNDGFVLRYGKKVIRTFPTVRGARVVATRIHNGTMSI